MYQTSSHPATYTQATFTLVVDRGGVLSMQSGVNSDSLIRADSVERRSYQESIARVALRSNTLVCIPTGLGKSVIAAYVAAERLRLMPDKSIVMLAPTKPLVLQHFRSFQRLINIDVKSVVWLTGEIGPEQRVELWHKRAILSTPQVFLNDLLTGKIALDMISLIIFDEAHRAVGDYAYVFIADQYASVNNGRILGLTASPGSSEADVREICTNLHLEWVEARTIDSDDVKPYVGGIEVKWVMIDLPQIFHDVKLDLEGFLREKLRAINDQGYLESAAIDRVRLRDVLAARQRILEDASREKGRSNPYLGMRTLRFTRLEQSSF